MRLGYGIAASRTRGHPFLNSATSAAKIKLAPEAKPQMKCVYPSEIACNISVRSLVDTTGNRSAGISRCPVKQQVFSFPMSSSTLKITEL